MSGMKKDYWNGINFYNVINTDNNIQYKIKSEFILSMTGGVDEGEAHLVEL